MKASDWFRPRQYVHLDWPLPQEKAEALVTDPDQVASHSFLPFITYSLAEPRYKRDERAVKVKLRPIGFSSHADSHIFAYYAHLMKERLEKAIEEGDVSSSVIAYRRFPGRKCNIHFADDVFEEVRARRNCVAVAIDVEKFFDNLDHVILKNAWAALFSVETLPRDHYAVFKAITRYATIDRDKIFAEFSIGRRARRRLIGPICSPVEFRERIRGNGLIEKNVEGKGIPQGSPISAMLSNLYLLGVDIRVQEFATKIRGVYRRYSDDILLLCDENVREDFEAFVTDQLGSVKLDINDDKTLRSCFRVDGDVITCDQPLQYLGFTFDGQRKLVRSKTLARYMRRVRQGFASASRAARKSAAHGGSAKIRRAEIYERYSHLGKRNFIKYAYRASEIMEDPSPRRQVRKHWRRLNEDISKLEEGAD